MISYSANRCTWTIFSLLASLSVLTSVHAQPPNDLDLSFLRGPPFERQKLATNLDTITKRSDLTLVKEAINDIIIFVHSSRSYSGQTADRFTEEGRLNFQSTPTATNSKGQQIALLPIRQYAWEVTDIQEIKLTSAYGLTTAKPRFSQRMVFKKIDGRWRFDRYEWRTEK